MAQEIKLDAEQREALREVNRVLGDALFGRPPRYRYFQKGNGPMFCWTVEKDGEPARYASFVYRPFGPGARSGKAMTHKLVESGKWKIVEHAKRKDAKARALRLYRAWGKEASNS